MLVDVTVSADKVHLICVGEQNNAIAMLINPAWLASRCWKRLCKARQAKPIYAVIVVLVLLSKPSTAASSARSDEATVASSLPSVGATISDPERASRSCDLKVACGASGRTSCKRDDRVGDREGGSGSCCVLTRMGWLAEREGAATRARFFGGVEVVETRFSGAIIISRLETPERDA
jgi:hypothetical protein